MDQIHLAKQTNLLSSGMEVFMPFCIHWFSLIAATRLPSMKARLGDGTALV